MKPINRDTAEFTAFLVLGAIHAKADLESFSGQIGFTQHAIDHARAIAKRLRDVFDQSHIWPGVLSYELIEPLGAELAANPGQTPEATADKFARQYLDWIEHDDGSI